MNTIYLIHVGGSFYPNGPKIWLRNRNPFLKIFNEIFAKLVVSIGGMYYFFIQCLFMYNYLNSGYQAIHSMHHETMCITGLTARFSPFFVLVSVSFFIHYIGVGRGWGGVVDRGINPPLFCKVKHHNNLVLLVKISDHYFKSGMVAEICHH